jgi:hypothetical protein
MFEALYSLSFRRTEGTSVSYWSGSGMEKSLPYGQLLDKVGVSECDGVARKEGGVSECDGVARFLHVGRNDKVKVSE